jgi:hypothetical protein
MNIAREVLKRISPYMKSKGFTLSGRNFYFISNDIAYCVAIDVPGGLLYATAYVMPLYVPCESRYYTYGDRINDQNKSMVPLLRKDADIETICKWCDVLCQCIETKIMPAYNQIGTPFALAEHVEHIANLPSSLFSCPQVFAERLKMFTYLYIRDFHKTDIAIECYRNLLGSSTFLTSMVRQKYLDESIAIRTLAQGNEKDLEDYFSKISTVTRSVL